MSKQCAQCTKEFYKKPSHSKSAWMAVRFCSRTCFGASKNGRPTWNAGLKLSTLPQYASMGFQPAHPRFTKNLHKFTPEESARGIPKRVASQRGKQRPCITGPNHHAWKGGYQNRLWLARRREAMRKGAEGSHTREEWDEVKAAFNNTCPACLKGAPQITLTEDHIVPLSKGGSDDISNIQPLCRSCNTRKYNRSVIFIGEHSLIN